MLHFYLFLKKMLRYRVTHKSASSTWTCINDLTDNFYTLNSTITYKSSENNSLDYFHHFYN